MAKIELKQEDTSESPSSGYLHIYAKANGMAVVRNSTGDEQAVQGDFTVVFSWDNADTVVPVNTRTVVKEIPFNGIIEHATLVSNSTGNIVVDVWKGAYADLPLNSGDSICGSNRPNLAAANKDQDTSLTGWTTSIGSGNFLQARIDSISQGSKVSLCLVGRKV